MHFVDVGSTEWRNFAVVKGFPGNVVHFVDVGSTEWRLVCAAGGGVRTVHFVDVGSTEWRPDPSAAGSLEPQVHLLMLVVPNGGSSGNGGMMPLVVVHFADVGSTEWRPGVLTGLQRGKKCILLVLVVPNGGAAPANHRGVQLDDVQNYLSFSRSLFSLMSCT